MSAVASKRFVLGCMFAVLLVTVGLHFAPVGSKPDAPEAVAGTAGPGLADSAGSFTITGTAAEPISPGVRAPLDLRLTNPHPDPMKVTDLRVTVRGVSAPNANPTHPCTVSDFVVDQIARGIEITVAPRATSSLVALGIPHAKQPHVGMLNTSVNQDGCKGASLTLAYTASGTFTGLGTYPTDGTLAS